MSKLTREHIFWNKIPINKIKKYYSTVLSCQSIISFLNNDSVLNYIFTKMNDMLKERNDMGTYVLICKSTIYEIIMEIKDSNLFRSIY